ncbi:hypothetical protein ABTX81_02685 [Kitasatospora sp. NPDC097605]|uniref:hypothetical protein n=1 Tax=Kitasatospora sp. NPDC097605 TaxID=3157226 RepID=UPI00333113A5
MIVEPIGPPTGLDGALAAARAEIGGILQGHAPDQPAVRPGRPLHRATAESLREGVSV